MGPPIAAVHRPLTFIPEVSSIEHVAMSRFDIVASGGTKPRSFFAWADLNRPKGWRRPHFR